MQKASPWGEKTASGLSRERLMRGDKSAPLRDVSFNRTGTTHGSFPTTYHFQQVTRFAGAQSAGSTPHIVPRAPAHQSGAIAAPSKKHLPPEIKNFPQEHPYRTKRNNSLPCTDGCSWGKFSVREGGLEGESPVFQEGALSLQGLSLSKVFLPLQGLSLPNIDKRAEV